MNRPYFQHSILQLEDIYRSAANNEATLRNLRDELARRGTMRAHALRKQVNDALDPITGCVTKTAEPSLEFEPEEAVVLTAPVEQAPDWTGVRKIDAPMPEICNRPADILAAWTALEVLSPPAFRRSEQLAGGDRRMIARISSGGLPWENGEKSRPGSRLYFQVLLGVVEFSAAVTDLLKVFADDRPEKFVGTDKAVLASVVVDREGRPIEDDSIAVSSFAWGLPIALSGELKSLGDWAGIERDIVKDLTEQLVKRDANGDVRPLTKASIDAARRWLVTRLEIPAAYVKPADFLVRVYMPFRRSDQPDPLLLNSFFLEDLALASQSFNEGKAPLGLRRYLGNLAPESRLDLLTDEQALSRLLRPSKFPAARWPGPSRHPLVLLQQAAVNAFHETPDVGSILGVNGPPGTGKTTLLRDIVADVVSQRADVLASIEDPSAAFEHSGQKIKAGNHWIHLYKLDRRLEGFELLIASSNNKAVENVSAELPGRGALADDSDLRYFKPLSDALLGRETWGAVAAVLGNASNRSAFRNTFWWDEDVALRRYLLELTGTPQRITEGDAEEGKTPATRLPLILAKTERPISERDAKARWHEARKTYQEVRTKAAEAAREMEQFRIDVAQLPLVVENAHRVTCLVNERPGFWARLFRSKQARAWSASNKLARHEYREALKVANLTSELRGALGPGPSYGSNDIVYRTALHELEAIANDLLRRKSEMGVRFVDANLREHSHMEQQDSVPWFDAQANRLRDDVFEAVMNLHKAFIDCAAKPLRHNLGALMTFFSGAKPSSPEVEGLIPDLWRSFFLVVPAVSTTFASVHRMLGLLPKEAIGCLVVDEAGQALPQAAVGAVFRAQRIVMVGDPIQVPPVVIMPNSLTSTICRRFGVDPDRFNAPDASAQTLADAASTYRADFETDQGSRTVGAPLLVHRRCSDPMFSIANEIAYGKLMVQGKREGQSTVRDALGPSAWFDVSSQSTDKWSVEEGELALSLLHRLAQVGAPPDIFVVTPFVSVQNGMRRLIETDPVLAEWIDEPRRWAFDRVGTIHTLQGREAEAVILVLGAPRPNELGARNWAGRQPNLLNVAVTRAKEAVYVVGSRAAWGDIGVFKVLSRYVPTKDAH